MKRNFNSTELPLGQLNAILELLLLLPRLWLVTAVLVILLSMIDVAYSAQTGWSFNFGIKSITAVMFGLIWLPVLLRILAVAGGGIKTGAGEANTPGLISLLPKLIATLDSVEPSLGKAEQEQVAAVRQEAEQKLGAAAAGSEAEARDRLSSLAREYEEVRRVMSSGSQRTFRMQEITARIRAMAGEAHCDSQTISAMFNRGSEGDRIVALQMLHRYPYRECFSLVVNAIAQPRSAFEQFAALKAASKMLSDMNLDQLQQLQQAILDQRSEGPNHWLTPEDKPRWRLSEQVLDAIADRLKGA
ncbi:hypothetical protein [Pseudanabaena sp. FACHB-2040]|uniref:hypothetical protein n=1 Tax=Pseudanabaena sp. FACHB-2040 TaxID=2692859 RepID=UPI0016845A67|nr:hypothetical protein [Pseudanabaena sp. FACHB-2040]MBD2260256.1 hypothetical protein [Pseudanabaena sp. FACHB-2040]